MNVSESEEYKDYFGKILFAISLIVLGVMVFLIIQKPFFHVDEWFTQGLLTVPFNDMIHITANDMHPPLYYVTVWAPVQLLNMLHIPFDKIFVMKMMSVAVYVVLYIISFTKVKKDYGWLAGGIFAFAIIAMSNLFTYFSVARMYPLGMLLLVCGFIAAGEILKDGKIKNWIILTVFTILGAYTQYFVGLSFGVLYILLLAYILIEKRTQLKFWLISAILAIVCFVPWMAPLKNQMSVVHESYWIQDITINSILEYFASPFSASTDFWAQLLFAVIFLALFAVIAMQYRKSPKENEFVMLGLLVFVGTIIIGVIGSLLFRPIIIARYLIPAIGVAWLAISIFISRLDFGKFALPAVMVILLIGAFCLASQVTDINGNHEYLVKDLNFLDSLNNENSVVVITEPVKYVHYNQMLDNAIVYQNFSIDKREPAEDFAKIYDDKDSKFLIPDDVEKYANKTIYIANPKSNQLNLPNGYSLEKIGQIERCEFSKLIHT